MSLNVVECPWKSLKVLKVIESPWNSLVMIHLPLSVRTASSSPHCCWTAFASSRFLRAWMFQPSSIFGQSTQWIFLNLGFHPSDQVIKQPACHQRSWMRSNLEPNIEQSDSPIRRQISNLNSCSPLLSLSHVKFTFGSPQIGISYYGTSDVNMNRDEVLVLPIPICFPDHPTASQVPTLAPSLWIIFKV